MHRILLCDDEGIVREGLKFIINKEFGESVVIEEAKSGRIAIEMAGTFRPDIIFMDIQMPGINGIEAMHEIRKEHKKVIFIVLTAYDRFTYAKEAIDVGVMDYLTKPINKDTVLSILNRAIGKIEEHRTKVSKEMEIKEKLEGITPIIESGFVSSIFLQDYDPEDMLQYKEFLGIEEEHGYMVLMKYGDDTGDGNLTNPVGAGVKGQKSSEGILEIIKEFCPTSFVSIMGNRGVLFVPSGDEQSYEERVSCIEKFRGMVRKLEQRFEMIFLVGIGSVVSVNELSNSFREAEKACRIGVGKVNHILDTPTGLAYGEEYPVETEKLLFKMLSKGKTDQVMEQAQLFMDWLKGDKERPEHNHRLKVLELILRAEYQVHHSGGMTYNFSEREGYLESILNCSTFDELEQWFNEKLRQASKNIAEKQHEYSSSLVKQAIDYIKGNYTKEVTLDDVSKEINISPYYFSKIFKEETGINFVEYLTKLRMDYASELLQEKEYSIKEICGLVGYSDPNYFSRIFKKWTGETPSDYREKGKRV